MRIFLYEWVTLFYDFDQWYVSLYMLSIFNTSPPFEPKLLCFFPPRICKVFFICWLHLDLDVNFSASYPDQLGICIHQIISASFFKKQLSCLFLKDRECLSGDWYSTILSYFANLYTEMYISIHLFLLFTKIKLN